MTAQLPLFSRSAALKKLLAPEPYPFDLEDAHFSSGVNHPGEVRGLALSGHNVGITASEVSEALLDELDLFYGGPLKVFVDTGAFSEVEFRPDGRKVVAPITDERWLEILALFKRLCGVLRPRQLFMVAPDAVGDQEETLRRMERYAPQIRELVKLGVNLIIPVQKGALSMADFWWRALAVLGLQELQAIAGIPMKKDATSLDELAELAGNLGLDARIHLLGLGPASPKFRPAVSAIARGCPWARVSSDSVTIRAKVGRSNGRGGGPRPLTAARDRALARGIRGVAELKASALMEVGWAEGDQKKQAARRAGWYDDELESAPGMPLEGGSIDYGPGGPFGEE